MPSSLLTVNRTVEGEEQRFGWTRVDGEDNEVDESGMTLWER